jgi:predicted nucleic acid-binding protein
MRVVDLDTEPATKAVDYAHKYGLAMADSIIYTTAMDTGADLLTCDLHFAELPRVAYFAKGPR